MPSHHTTKDRSSFRVSGLAVSAVYSPLTFVSSMCTYSAQASQSRAAALSFGIRLLARPTPRASRLAELRDVLRRYAANGNIVCVVLESDNLGQEKNDL